MSRIKKIGWALAWVVVSPFGYAQSPQAPALVTATPPSSDESVKKQGAVGGGASEDVTTAVRNLIAGYGDQQLSAMNQLPYDAANTHLAGQTWLDVAKVAGDWGQQSAFETSISYLLTPPPPTTQPPPPPPPKKDKTPKAPAKGGSSDNLTASSTQAAQQAAASLGVNGMNALLIKIPGSDFSVPIQNPDNSTKTPMPQDRSFDFSSLMGTTQLLEPTSTSNVPVFAFTMESAMNFISAVSHIGGVSSLVPVIPADKKGSTIANATAAYNDPKFQYYRANYLAYVSSMSVALNNFNAMMAERVMVPGLAKSVGLSPSDSKYAEMSPLAIDQQLATKRLSLDWKKNMAQASPAALEREMVNLMAEMNYRMYQQHIDNERIIAALSVLVIQNNVTYRNTVLTNALAALPANEGGTSKSSVSNPATQAAQGKDQQAFPKKVQSSS